MTIKTVIGVAAAFVLVLTTGSGGFAPTASAEAYPVGPVTMTAGAGPGSGFDLTIRSVVEALQKEKLVDVGLPVANRRVRPGLTSSRPWSSSTAGSTTRYR